MALSQISFQFDELPGGEEKPKKDEINIPAQKHKRGRKSLKDMSADSGRVDIPADEELFKKQYYSIGDVAN
ncbi:MAG: hypothetical protein ABIO82_01715, partial [Ginsengibacter sp.]